MLEFCTRVRLPLPRSAGSRVGYRSESLAIAASESIRLATDLERPRARLGYHAETFQAKDPEHGATLITQPLRTAVQQLSFWSAFYVAN